MKNKSKSKIFRLTREVVFTENIVKDINELLEVLSPGKGKSINITRLQKLVGHPFLEIHVIEVAGKVSGMASLHLMEVMDKTVARIEDVVVHPKHQGKGFGEKIMSHVIEQAKKKGIDSIELTSNPKRAVANKLYQKLKFEPRKTNVYRLKLKK